MTRHSEASSLKNMDPSRTSGNVKNNLTSPLTAAVVTIWAAWILMTYSQRMYFADNPGQVVYTWMKVRSIQGFNGLWTTLLLYRLYRWLSDKNSSFVSKAAWVAFSTYACAVVNAFINASVYRYFFEEIPLFHPWQRYLVIAISKYFIILGLSIFYFMIIHWQAFQKQKEKTLTAVALANEAQLQMLRYQLNPHFLFNALNSVRTLVYENPRKAEKVITDLSEFLRYTLVNEIDHVVTLSDEMDIIRNYLEIQKIRFEDQLVIDINITAEALQYKVPCFLIHPLVENAIKYGLETSPAPLKIHINAAVEGNTLDACVRNSGKLNHNSTLDGCGKGLNNIRMRLNHFFPKRNSFRLFEKNRWVHAVVQITQ